MMWLNRDVAWKTTRAKCHSSEKEDFRYPIKYELFQELRTSKEQVKYLVF